MSIEVSVVIPVHNGAHLLRKRIENVLAQSLKSIEIILVENGSADNSFALCRRLEKEHLCIKVHHNDEPSTSLARKKGVQMASGKYVVFSDQDDRYINSHAIEDMCRTIDNDQADIVVFGYYKQYYGVLKRQIKKSECSLSRSEILRKEIKGVMGVPNSLLDQPVWNKIYRTAVVKDAVEHIEDSLCFAEDELLNIWAFVSHYTQKVTVHNEAYYVWSANVGYSSKSDSNQALLWDYNVVKPLAAQIVAKHMEDPISVLWDIHLESLYCLKYVVTKMISEETDRLKVIDYIDKIQSLEYIKEAKKYVNTYPDQSKIWEDLRFLASESSASEYYEYIKSSQNSSKRNLITSLKQRFATLLKNGR